MKEEEAPDLPLIPATVAGQIQSADGKTRAKSLQECMCVCDLGAHAALTGTDAQTHTNSK